MSARACMGYYYEHIKVALKHRGSATLAELVSTMAGVRIPDSLRGWYTIGRLVAVAKDSGGVRAVGIKTCLGRLQLRYVLSKMKMEVQTLLRSVGQYGVGVRGGMDAIIHAVQLALEAQPEDMLVSLDMKAAFQFASRAEAMRSIESELPAFTESFLLHYGSVNQMIYTYVDTDGRVQRGVVQAAEGSVHRPPSA